MISSEPEACPHGRVITQTLLAPPMVVVAFQTTEMSHLLTQESRFMTPDRHTIDFTACPVLETLAKQRGRKQAILGEHQRQQVETCEIKTGKTSTEVRYALPSLGPSPATAEQLAAPLRNHWEIENRRHYVRDVTYDEDRCRVNVLDLPRDLACLAKTAISIIRCLPQFRYVPEANRHFAARPQEALA